jgi:hypothetical protein
MAGVTNSGMVLFPSLPGSSAAQTIHLPAINPNAAVIITICFMLVCLFVVWF